MKIFVEETKPPKAVSTENYIKKITIELIELITEVRDNLYKDKEEVTAIKLMLCKTKLENLLNNLTYQA